MVRFNFKYPSKIYSENIEKNFKKESWPTSASALLVEKFQMPHFRSNIHTNTQVGTWELYSEKKNAPLWEKNPDLVTLHLLKWL